MTLFPKYGARHNIAAHHGCQAIPTLAMACGAALVYFQPRVERGNSGLPQVMLAYYDGPLAAPATTPPTDDGR